MNQSWESFLLEQRARFDAPSDINKQAGQVYPVIDLAVLTVAGKDAAQFLQGQVTCNINELTDKRCSFGAFCNAKGRVIASFLVFKAHGNFFLIMPGELLGSVIEKLRKYILRADVQLIDNRDEYCLIGIANPSTKQPTAFPERDLDIVPEPYGLLKLPSSQSRYLAVSQTPQAIELWSLLTEKNGFQAYGAEQWRFLDIEDRIPWLNETTSEEFIPQMLNLDQLGGISFNKGCYTGQEIVARTHYLGKAKRMLFLAESNCTELPSPNTAILNSSGQTLGKVLRAEKGTESIKILAVLPASEIDNENLILDVTSKDKINLITL